MNQLEFSQKVVKDNLSTIDFVPTNEVLRITAYQKLTPFGDGSFRCTLRHKGTLVASAPNPSQLIDKLEEIVTKKEYYKNYKTEFEVK